MEEDGVVGGQRVGMGDVWRRGPRPCVAARAAAFERQCRGGEAGLSIEDMQAAAADAVERLRRTLSKQNVASYLSDLPQDVDVVSVEAIRPRVDRTRYARANGRER